jgi:hypothetical protein
MCSPRRYFDAEVGWLSADEIGLKVHISYYAQTFLDGLSDLVSKDGIPYGKKTPGLPVIYKCEIFL